MKKFNLVRREIANYLFLRKVLIKESKNTSQDSPWKKFNLRMNWYCRTYTVVSLREQDMGEELLVQNWKAMEMMRPINDYLTSLDLQEIIFPSIEKIPDSRSYLVVYSPIFKELTVGWVFKNFLYLSVFAVIAIVLIKNLL
jgi:hypothetical protein